MYMAWGLITSTMFLSEGPGLAAGVCPGVCPGVAVAALGGHKALEGPPVLGALGEKGPKEEADRGVVGVLGDAEDGQK